MTRKVLSCCFVLLPTILLAQGWVARYNGAGNDADKAAAIAVDPAGNVYVTGFSTGSGSGHDYLTIKYNSHGETLWTQCYTSPGNADDEAVALVLDDAGNVYVTGRARAGNHDIALTISYTSAGVQQWICPVAAPSGDSNAAAKAIAIDGDRNTYICGYMRGLLGNDDYLVAKITSAGAVSFVRAYDGPGNGNDTANAIAVHADGDFYVTGSSPGSGTGIDFATIKYNSAGDTTWIWRYDGPGSATDAARAIAVDDSGYVYVTGQSWGISTVYDYATIKYQPSGDTAWVRRYNYASQDGVELPYALKVDATGNVYVTGSSEGAHDEDYATVKYASNGTQRWVSRYNGSSNAVDEAKAIAIDAAGNVYVTGYSESGHDYDVYTIQYDSTGATRWSDRYDYSPPHDDDQGVAIIEPVSGMTYVAGFSYGSTGYDYLTIKYLAHDVGIVSYNFPTGTMPPQPVVPEVTIHNYGVFSETLAVHLWIAPVGQPASYYDVQTVYGISTNSDEDIPFRSFSGGVGNYVVRCSIGLARDLNRENDTIAGNFSFLWTTTPYWTQMAYLPPGVTGKYIKDGGALTFGRITGGYGYAVYALKGNNTIEFNRYSLNGDTWQRLESIPYTWAARKRVKKGGSLTYNRYDTTVFALKGNNTLELWKYGVQAHAWYLMPDVPLGYSMKKVKGGAGLVFWHHATGEDWVFAQKGTKTNELWGYYVQGNTWWGKAMIPPGPSGRGMGDGSCIVNAGGTFYLLKGSYNEFYAYYPNGDSFQTKKSLPLVGLSGRKKKAKDGTCLCYDSDRRVIYCLKGSTDEFWSYYPGADTWVQQMSIPLAPSGKYVKTGGALAFGDHYVWAFKGNKTLEFWQYYHGDDDLDGPGHDAASCPRASADAQEDVVSRGRTAVSPLTITPNPVTDATTINFTLSEPGACCLRLYDLSGKLVTTLAAGYYNAGSHSVSIGHWSLRLGHYLHGVYVLRFEGPGRSISRKLIIE